jgi:sterol desaturase/sphingolipid hydroxylase (fatty acid hydroxylase superfamily)
VDPTIPEMQIRLTAFVACFAVLAVAEAMVPRRRRALGRRQRWGDNLGLVTVDTIVVRLVSPVSAVGVAALSEAGGWGLLRVTGPWPAWLGVILALVWLDFAIYLQHVLFHAVPALWRLHRVHHTDLELDVSTGVRFHPVEILLSVGFKSAAVAALGAPVAGVVLFEVVLNAGSLFSHANLWLPATADRLLRLVLVTPDMHRVHHSADPSETDTNFGFTLSWWDRLLGTYNAQPKAGHDAMEIGVVGFDSRVALGLLRLVIQPVLMRPAAHPAWTGSGDSLGRQPVTRPTRGVDASRRDR